MARDFVAALKRHSVELQDLEGDQADEFLRLLRELQDQVKARLTSIGDASVAVDAFSLTRIEAETKIAIQTLELKAKGKWSKAAQVAVDMSVEHLGDELDRLSTAFDGTSFDVTLDAAKALSDPAQGLLANHFDSSVSRYGNDLLNGVRQRLFVGLRTGDSIGAIAKDVASDRGPFGIVGQSNATRLVRTEVSQAYGAAQHSGLAQAHKQAPQLKKVWLHIASFICPVCIPLHGTERPLDGTWTIRQGRRTKEVAHAPAHPHCACRVTGMTPKWRKAMQGLGYLQQSEDDTPAELNSV